MKKITLFALLVLLIGCSKQTTDKTYKFDMPVGLADCKIYELASSGGRYLYITRCGGEIPTVATTTTEKYPVTTMTIDGKDYNSGTK